MLARLEDRSVWACEATDEGSGDGEGGATNDRELRPCSLGVADLDDRDLIELRSMSGISRLTRSLL